MAIWVVIKTTFEGYHRWKDAPGEIAFLRDFHRHLFYVTCYIKVEGVNRQLEFFTVKKMIDGWLSEHYTHKHFEDSCEMICLNLKNTLCSVYETEIKVSVYEDNENGALVA